MVTKIFHPNISKSGEICVDTLKKGWKKEYGVGHVLIVCVHHYSPFLFYSTSDFVQLEICHIFTRLSSVC